MSVVHTRLEARDTSDGAPSLDEAIDQLIALGHKDPDDGIDALILAHGEEWLIAAVDPIKFARDRYVERIAANRRAGQRETNRTGVLSDRELLAGACTFRPSPTKALGWSLIGKMTREEHLARAAFYRSKSKALEITATRYERYAALLSEHGVETLNELPSGVDWRAS